MAFAAVAVAYLLYSSQANTVRTIAQAAEARIVDVARQRFVLSVGSVAADVSYLAEQNALRSYLAQGTDEALEGLKAEYLAFARHRAFFDQLRFIDTTGREIVRVNRSGASVVLASPDQLGNTAGQPYMQETLKLDRGQVYISELDLNIENGAIEQPLKPTIRVGTPVFDEQGTKRGMVIVNYLGQRLLDRISELETGATRIWLVNSDGYWLLGPTPEDTFAFMYPERAARTFAATYPNIWQQMQAAPADGQLRNEAGRFTYVRADAVGERAEDAVAASPRSWFVVIYTPAAVLMEQTGELRRNMMVAGGMLLLMMAAISIGLARHQVHRRETEQRIRLSETQFRAVTETASDAIVSADSSGNIQYFNPAAERIFGYHEDEAMGQPLTILMPERLRQAHIEGLQHYLASRQPKVIGKTIEIIGKRRDGREFPIDLALASSEVEGDVFFTAIIRDITERVEAERHLRASEARFRDLLESAPDAVLITDQEGRIQLANAQAEFLFGYGRKELIGQTIEMLMPPRYRSGHIGHRQGYVRAARTRPMGAGLELQGLRKDGSEFPVSISLSPTRTHQGMAVFCSVRDITDQRAKEAKIEDLNRRLQIDNAELEAVNKELEAFSYSVSHDLRAPLRAIDGFSQALIEDAGPLLDPEHHSHLNRVRQAAQRMGLLIDDLIKLARVTRSDVRISNVDLSAIAEQITEALQDSAPERQVEFIIAPDLHAEGDARLLQVALDNLLSNSWKFTAPRSPARIEFGANRVNGARAFFVRDNGVGFDMSYAGKMFGAFQRFHDAREFAGTGIGLATVQRIIHKHGGRIWADSRPGNGATFFFTL